MCRWHRRVRAGADRALRVHGTATLATGWRFKPLPGLGPAFLAGLSPPGQERDAVAPHPRLSRTSWGARRLTETRERSRHRGADAGPLPTQPAGKRPRGGGEQAGWGHAPRGTAQAPARTSARSPPPKLPGPGRNHLSAPPASAPRASPRRAHSRLCRAAGGRLLPAPSRPDAGSARPPSAPRDPPQEPAWPGGAPLLQHPPAGSRASPGRSGGDGTHLAASGWLAGWLPARGWEAPRGSASPGQPRRRLRPSSPCQPAASRSKASEASPAGGSARLRQRLLRAEGARPRLGAAPAAEVGQPRLARRLRASLQAVEVAAVAAAAKGLGSGGGENRSVQRARMSRSPACSLLPPPAAPRPPPPSFFPSLAHSHLALPRSSPARAPWRGKLLLGVKAPREGAARGPSISSPPRPCCGEGGGMAEERRRLPPRGSAPQPIVLLGAAQAVRARRGILAAVRSGDRGKSTGAVLAGVTGRDCLTRPTRGGAPERRDTRVRARARVHLKGEVKSRRGHLALGFSYDKQNETTGKGGGGGGPWMTSRRRTADPASPGAPVDTAEGAAGPDRSTLLSSRGTWWRRLCSPGKFEAPGRLAGVPLNVRKVPFPSPSRNAHSAHLRPSQRLPPRETNRPALPRHNGKATSFSAAGAASRQLRPPPATKPKKSA